jgi:hypothetical protein
MSQKKIVYDASVEPNANPNYGQITVTNIRYDDGSSVSIQRFLGIIFDSPAVVGATDFWASTDPWMDIKADFTSEQIEATRFAISGQLNFPNSYTFKTSDKLFFGINGDLTKDPDRYTKSFVFAPDQVPDINGTVNVHCADAPDPALASHKQTLTFSEGARVIAVTVSPGTDTPVLVPAGTYTVTAAELTTPDETVVAAAQVSPSTVTVVIGEETNVEVTYGDVQKYSALDVVIGAISGLENEQLHVTVADRGPGTVLADFSTPTDHTTPLRRLPSSGTAEVTVDSIALNNTQYSFDPKNVDLSPEFHEVSILQDDVKTTPVDTTGFVQVPIDVQTDLSLDTTVTVRLISPSLVYTQAVKVQAGTTPFDAVVAPGEYTVKASSFLEDGTNYVVLYPATLTVAPDGSARLQVKIQRGANLHVRGFPNFLSFGGCADLTPNNQADFVAARASSVFKYAGIDGAGDPGTFLSDDPATTRTIALARAVEAELGDGNPVLPVMISYTCNLSGGDMTNLQSVSGLGHSFANLILSLNLANNNIDDQHPVPAGFLVNADFIGACQQHGLTADYQMPVREPLQTALDHWKVSASIPDSITEDIRGYVAAVNWLIKTVAPAVTFGWQVNLWQTGSSFWVYGDDDPMSIAQQTADYVNSLGVYDGENRPDYLAVDRYEADDLTIRSYGNGYLYGPREWDRFFEFCRNMGLIMHVPIMAWQIPSSRLPLVSDAVNDDFDSQHWGTGGTHVLGDAGINSDMHNINPKILALQVPNVPIGPTVADVFRHSEPFDMTNPAYLGFPVRGIFAVLLGGGSTTGIVSSVGNAVPWVTNKLNAYMENPISFDTSIKSF